MDKRKDMGIIGATVAVIVAVVGISVVWAAYTSSLTIKGSATAEGASWNILFKNLGSAQTGNTSGVTSTAKEITAPSISGSTSIENFSVSVKTPGDYVSYTFKIKNDGNFNAKIDSNFTMPTPTCTNASSINGGAIKNSAKNNDIFATPLGYTMKDIIAVPVDNDGSSSELTPPDDAKTDAQKVCENLVYTLTYTDGGAAVKAGDVFNTGVEKEVILKLQYKENISSSNLPTSNVSISGLNITIPFIQK